ncbi:MAG TPA: hypothetical protein VHA57_09925 [Actinomycetota bacterium]|nr:hypothetical protein [Actinomycetota bacterium]
MSGPAWEPAATRTRTTWSAGTVGMRTGVGTRSLWLGNASVPVGESEAPTAAGTGENARILCG